MRLPERIRDAISVAATLAWAAGAHAAVPAFTGASPVSVVGQRCEYRIDPIGLGVREPRLSWRLESSRRGELQTAYRILAATSEARLTADTANLWDSGEVPSGQSIHVPYAGPALGSRQRVFWKVRVWDRDGRPSRWSPAAHWEMGLLSAADWSASWIGAPREGESPDETAPVEKAGGVDWIWYPEGDPRVSAPAAARYFRFTFDVPGNLKIESAVWLVAADNAFRASVNGRDAFDLRAVWDFRRFTRFPVSALLVPGRNVLALAATNTGGPAGLAAVLQVRYVGGTVQRVATGGQWRAAAEAPEAWTGRDFDDAGWVRAERLDPVADESWKVRSFHSPVSPPATYLRRGFALAKAVRRARVYATAKGLYDLYVDGERVGEDLLRPGWTDYRDRFQYQTYDVTAKLRPGAHAIGVLLGDGWYAGHVADWGRENWGRATRALVQLEIDYADGTSDRIVTDGSWKRGTGPILASDLVMGEAYDARREIPGWASAAFDDGGWSAPELEPLGTIPLVAQQGPGVRRVEELRARSVAEKPAGSFVVDLGQNMVGRARLAVQGPAGTTVRLRFAEMLEADGSIYTTNLRTARATDTYTLRGVGREVYEPSFTLHGFRYVEVTGYPGTPGLDAVTGIVISSATAPTGSFETSSPLVDQLQHNIEWGQRGNYVEVPTDCPQRDERLGWMGDAQVFARTACFNTDVAGFWTKWLQDVRDTQSPAGAFPDYAPDRNENPSGAPGWGDAGVIVPWTFYECYGDKRLLADQYESMARWIAYVRDANPDRLWLKNSGANYGDWLNIAADAPRPVLATAYFAYSIRLLSRIARVLGRGDDAAKYERLFEEVRAAFNAAYVSGDGRIQGDTQTVYLLALRFDLLSPEKRALAADHLVRDIVEKRRGHLSTGFLGVSYLNPTLTDIGRLDLAYRLLNNDTFPSWGYSIKQGATTIWERWDGWTAEKGFQNPGMNSFNHYSLGSVGEWLYATVAGIDLDADHPAYEHSLLHPSPGGGLTHAKASFDSLYGRIVSDWSLEDASFRWSVTVPPNTTATLRIPTTDPRKVAESGKPATVAPGLRYVGYDQGRAVFEAGSGSYAFEAPLVIEAVPSTP